MTKREKDFEKASMDYCEDHSHCIYFEEGADYGYQYAKDLIGKLLLCIELSNFFPTLDEDEEIAKGRKKLIEFIHETMEEL